MPEDPTSSRLITEYLGKLVTDSVPPHLPPPFAEDTACIAFHEEILAVRKAVSAFAQGDFSQEITARGVLADACKTLQANLRHLIWKVQQVERGDYSHRIDFLGELSAAFNSMATQLENNVKALYQKEEIMINLAKSLQEETKKHAEKRISTLQKLQQSERELRYQAQHDLLTGILNRRSFFELVGKKISSGLDIGKSCAVCMLDIDWFKRFNDTYGHILGDQVLKHVVQSCQSCLRQSDCMGRYGGEEFVFFFSDADTAQAMSIAERIRTTLENTPFVLKNGASMHITASLGVCVLTEAHRVPFQDELLNSLIDQADKAMYRAKNRGRNCVEVTVHEQAGSAPDFPRAPRVGIHRSLRRKM